MGRRRLLSFLFPEALVMLAATLCSWDANGQEERTGTQGFDQVRVFILDGANQLVAVNAQCHLGIIDSQFAQTLTEEPARSELDLLDTQATQIQEAADKLRDLRNRLGDMIRAAAQRDAGKSEKNDATAVVKERDELLHKMQGILVGFQQKDVKRHQRRKEMIELGLQAGIDQWIPKELNADKATLDRLRDVLSEQRQAASAFRREEREGLQKKTLECLTPEQRRQLDAELGDTIKYYAGSIEVTLWQWTSDNMEPAAEPLPAMEELNHAADCFQLSIAGKVSPAAFPVLRPGRFFRFAHVCSAPLYGALELVSFQRVELFRPDESERLRAEQMQQKIGEATQKFVAKKINYDACMEAAFAEMDAFERWKASRIEETVLPMQREELRKIILRRLVTMRGLPACLATGTLGRDLAITPEQRKQLLHLVEDEGPKLAERARKVDARVWEGVRNAFTGADREAFDDMVGTPPKSFFPAFDILLREKAVLE